MVTRKILSIIPARGGSKGIPKKNLVKINKKPLLFYTVNASLNSKLINKTIVSSDNEKILQYAKKLGTEIIKRPKKFASDTAQQESVINHVLKNLEKNEKYIPDIIVLLQNTSPLRTSKHIDESLKQFFSEECDSMLSVYNTHKLFWKIKNGKSISISYNPLKRPRRQEMKGEFVENGSIFITTLRAFQKSNCRISGKIGLYIMEEKDSIDIDNKFDLFLTSQILKKSNNMN